MAISEALFQQIEIPEDTITHGGATLPLLKPDAPVFDATSLEELRTSGGFDQGPTPARMARSVLLAFTRPPNSTPDSHGSIMKLFPDIDSVLGFADKEFVTMGNIIPVDRVIPRIFCIQECQTKYPIRDRWIDKKLRGAQIAPYETGLIPEYTRVVAIVPVIEGATWSRCDQPDTFGEKAKEYRSRGATGSTISDIKFNQIMRGFYLNGWDSNDPTERHPLGIGDYYVDVDLLINAPITEEISRRKTASFPSTKENLNE